MWNFWSTSIPFREGRTHGLLRFLAQRCAQQPHFAHGPMSIWCPGADLGGSDSQEEVPLGTTDGLSEEGGGLRSPPRPSSPSRGAAQARAEQERRRLEERIRSLEDPGGRAGRRGFTKCVYVDIYIYM